MVYDAPGDFDWSGQVLAKVKSQSGKPVLLAEVRGDGQYAVVTGPNRPDLSEDFSPHPVTVEYFEQLVSGARTMHDPSTSVIADRAFQRAAAAGVATAGVRHSGDTGDVLRQAILADPDLWTLLLDPGWTVISTHPNFNRAKDGTWETRVCLQRPDYGSPADGESGNAQGAVLQVFSTTVKWYPGHTDGMSAMTAVAAAWFDGDYAKACREAESTARVLVLDGVPPVAGSPFEAWPHDLLAEVHAARTRHDTDWRHDVATGGMDTAGLTAAAGPVPENAPVTESDGFGKLRMLPGTTSADEQYQLAKVKDRLRDLNIEAEARLIHAERTAADPDLAARALQAKILEVGLFESARAAHRASMLEAMAEGLSAQSADDIFAEPDPSAIWGRDSEVLWARDQPIHIFGVTGVGKSTITQQLVRAALTPGGADFLGWPVAPMDRVLYLAADRPSQIKGLMRAHFRELQVRGLLKGRLVVWPGPTPVSPCTDEPLAFRQWIERVGAGAGWTPRIGDAPGAGLVLPDLVVFDSLKDFVPDVNSAVDAGRYRRTVNLLVALGVQVLEMHHVNKSTSQTGLDRGSGHTFFSAGVGSTVSVMGEPGALNVTVSLLKPPMGEIPAFRVQHDRVAHVSTSLGAAGLPPTMGDPVFDAVQGAPFAGMTVTDIAEKVHGPMPAGLKAADWSARRAVDRQVTKLVNDGVLTCVSGTSGSRTDPPRYRVTLSAQVPGL
jgi:replicative DNA helicase